MNVIVQIRSEHAPALHGRAPADAESDEVLRAAAELGVKLAPLHPGTTDQRLARYFSVTTASAAAAQQAAERLRHCRAVQSAHIPPPASAP